MGLKVQTHFSDLPFEPVGNPFSFFVLNIFLNFIYFEREGESASREGAERERGRERIPRRLHAVSREPRAGLKLMNREIMTWAQIKSRTLNWLSHPSAPGNPFSTHLCTERKRQSSRFLEGLGKKCGHSLTQGKLKSSRNDVAWARNQISPICSVSLWIVSNFSCVGGAGPAIRDKKADVVLALRKLTL